MVRISSPETTVLGTEYDGNAFKFDQNERKIFVSSETAYLFATGAHYGEVKFDLCFTDISGDICETVYTLSYTDCTTSATLITIQTPNTLVSSICSNMDEYDNLIVDMS